MDVNQVYMPFVLGNDSNHFISILYGGSGSGKSHSIVQHLIVKCLSGKHKVLVLRKTGVTLKESVIALFLDILSRDNIPYIYRKVDRVLFIGQSEVHFNCIDDPERIKSLHGYDICWLEECTEFYPEDIDQLFLRLRDKDRSPRFIFSFNPINKQNYVFRYFFDKMSKEYMLDGKDFYILKTTWRDNIPFLPKQYIDNLKSLRKSNPKYYGIYSEGEWGILGRLVFDYGDYEVKHVDIPFNAKYIDGMDLGWTDPTALACSAVWKEDGIYHLHTYKTWSKSEVTADVIASILKKYCEGRTVYCDNAAAAQIAEIQKAGYYNARSNTKLPGSVISGIERLHSMVWTIEPECTDLIADLQIYQWKLDKKTGLYLEEPERGAGEYHQNQCDAVRYSLEALGNNISLSKIHAKGL